MIKTEENKEPTTVISRKEAMEQSKVFNDPVHGHMELHPLLCKVIDTPQFQRLRNIKQLGGAYYVYPGASHNRFEHSIGVAHLAGQFAQTLKERQPELGIDDKDVLCVALAGLCHDLGHGPFSHMFDGMFIPKVRPDLKWKHEKASIDMFDHLVKENGLESLMKKYGLDENDSDFIKEMIYGPLKSDSKEKDSGEAGGDGKGEAKEGRGGGTGGEAGNSQWPYKGRTQDKSFLYEIVSNERTKIDVDKFDYFARDCLHLGMKNSFDHSRFIQFARVCKVAKDDQPEGEGQPKQKGQPEGEWQICVRDKEVSNIYEMFHTRGRLHRRAYQHKVNKIIELMITEAIVKADRHIRIEGSGRRMFTLSETIDDMDAYTKLNDHVFDEILNSSSEGLKKARKILQRVVTRDLYQHLGRAKLQEKQDTTKVTDSREAGGHEGGQAGGNEGGQAGGNEGGQAGGDEGGQAGGNEGGQAGGDEGGDAGGHEGGQAGGNEGGKAGGEAGNSQKKLEEKLAEAFGGTLDLKSEDFAIIVGKIDFGMKDKNPIDNLRFYNKIHPDNAFKIPNDQVSELVLPTCFSEQWIHVYSRKSLKNKQLKAAKKAFEEWRQTSSLDDLL